MGFLDRLLGRQPSTNTQAQGPLGHGRQGEGEQGHYPSDDGQQRYGQRRYNQPPDTGKEGARGHRSSQAEAERAVSRYQFLLRTAPPETIEAVHAEAFAKLTPQQRQQVLARFTGDFPEDARPLTDEPQELGRAAALAELRQPGYLQHLFGAVGRGSIGAGGVFAGANAFPLAGLVVGSAIAGTFIVESGYGSTPEAILLGGGGYDGGGYDGAAGGGFDGSSDSGGGGGYDGGGGFDGGCGGFDGGGGGFDGGGGGFDGGGGGFDGGGY